MSPSYETAAPGEYEVVALQVVAQVPVPVGVELGEADAVGEVDVEGEVDVDGDDEAVPVDVDVAVDPLLLPLT